jgi:antitoxin component YwqK of YwqJK toxin-antitoxin module
LKLTVFYEKNLKVKTWVDYFENGRPKEITSYKLVKIKSKVDYGFTKDRVLYESIKEGYAASFSAKDFQLTETGNYKEGEKEGEWTAFYPGGRIPAVISNYKNGKLNGLMKQFDKRGKLLQEMEFKNGVKDGRFVIYDKKGGVLKEKHFKDGMEDGNGKTFSPR